MNKVTRLHENTKKKPPTKLKRRVPASAVTAANQHAAAQQSLSAALDQYVRRLADAGIIYQRAGSAVSIDCPICTATARSNKCQVKIGDTLLVVACHKCGLFGDEMREAMLERGIPWVTLPAAGDWWYTAKFCDFCYQAVLDNLKRYKTHGDNLRDRGFTIAERDDMQVKSVIRGIAADEELQDAILDDIEIVCGLNPSYEKLDDKAIKKLVAAVPGFIRTGGRVRFSPLPDPGMIMPSRDRFGLITRLRVRLDE